MPDIGEIRHGIEIGRADIRGLFGWCACIDCGKERWVRLSRGKPRRIRCLSCRGKGERAHNWRGGRVKTSGGYMHVYVSSDDFFYSMADVRGHVREHRLVMAKHLKRCLLPWEVVHHKNGIRDDNRIENLELLPTNRQHVPSTKWQAELAKRDKRIAQLEARLTLLEAENVLLIATEPQRT